MSDKPLQLSGHPIHPWYGPCDGLAEGGECAECTETARQVNERVRALEEALKQIAGIAGNLSDEAVQKVGGVNDARRWALAVVHARQIARSLLVPAHPTPAREG